MLNTIILILVAFIAISLVRFFFWQYSELKRRRYGRTPRHFSLFGPSKKKQKPQLAIFRAPKLK